MLPASQRVVRLMQRPVGLVKPGIDLVVDSAPVLPSGRLGDGEYVVRNLWLSLDPAMRGWMNDAKSYIEPVKIGDVMRGGCVGRVVSSKNSRFSEGSLVVGMFGWQEFCHVKDTKAIAAHEVMPVPGLSPSAYLGVLGMTGMTAYFGLLDIGKPKPGDTVVVSAAAGATGSVVCQIAKHVLGCRVVGIAGGPEKCAWLRDELGVDATVDYKNTDNFYKSLKAVAPSCDVYFDNVGGEQLEAALALLNRGARVVICGAISQYNATTPSPGPSTYLKLLTTRSRMEGFIVFDYSSRFGEAAADLGKWLAEGKLKFKEHVVHGGVEAAPDALHMLFQGRNQGKLVVQIAPDDVVATSRL